MAMVRSSWRQRKHSEQMCFNLIRATLQITILLSVTSIARADDLADMLAAIKSSFPAKGSVIVESQTHSEKSWGIHDVAYDWESRQWFIDRGGGVDGQLEDGRRVSGNMHPDPRVGKKPVTLKTERGEFADGGSNYVPIIMLRYLVDHPHIDRVTKLDDGWRAWARWPIGHITLVETVKKWSEQLQAGAPLYTMVIEVDAHGNLRRLGKVADSASDNDLTSLPPLIRYHPQSDPRMPVVEVPKNWNNDNQDDTGFMITSVTYDWTGSRKEFSVEAISKRLERSYARNLAMEAKVRASLNHTGDTADVTTPVSNSTKSESQPTDMKSTAIKPASSATANDADEAPEITRYAWALGLLGGTMLVAAGFIAWRRRST